jgi:hypothetical protein
MGFHRGHQLFRVGFTILTPLPGTQYFEQSGISSRCMDWSQYDLHHLLWKPRLPVERFFELYCETWRRTVLNAAGRKKWWQWLPQVDPRHIVPHGPNSHPLAAVDESARLPLAEYSIPADAE